jgi:hypothetical protein
MNGVASAIAVCPRANNRKNTLHTVSSTSFLAILKKALYRQYCTWINPLAPVQGRQVHQKINMY